MMFRVKRLLSLLVIISMLIFPTLSGYAAASFHDYIPEIPKFFTVSYGKITFNVSIDAEPNSKKFYDSFYSDGKPYFILLEQHSYWPSKEDSKEPYYKNFVVTFVKPKIQNPQSSLGTFLYEGATNGDNGSTGNKAPYYIAPMSYVPTSAGYESVSFIYDSDDNICYQTGTGSSTYPIRFTYVLASSATFKNGTPKEYPYFNALSNKEHTFVSEVVSPWKDRHYNWWLGVNGSINNPDTGEDTDGDGKADLNVDTDKDGKPDLNVDPDKDGKPDLNVDTNKDNKPDINIDTNNDRFPDINIDTNGDLKPDLNVDTNGDGKPDTNLKPDAGSGGGSSGTGSGGGGTGDHENWFPKEDDNSNYNGFPIFNPFDPNYEDITPPDSNNPYSDYDPLKDYHINNMPEMDLTPNFGDYEFTNPFVNKYPTRPK